MIAAYSRRGPPHTPMRKYIGRSIISQKTKNRKKSRAQNTPIMPVSSRRKSAKYPFTPVAIPNDANMQRKQRSAVSSTIVMLSPSMPTKYSMPKGGIHDARSTNW